jgi:translation initiation factor 2 subunit 1
MIRQRNEAPQIREVVLGKVKAVNPYSALISLTEYPGIEGMVHISEVANKWIKDIRNFIKPGQNVVAMVMRIDQRKGHYSLSLKRVSRSSKDEKMKEYKRENKAEKMLKMAAKKMNMTLEEAYDEIGFKLQDEFDEIFKAFQLSQTEPGREFMKKREIPEKWIKIISEIAEFSMKQKEVIIKLPIEIKSFEGDGISLIKSALSKLDKGISIKYISAPQYVLEIKSKEAKQARKLLTKTAEAIQAKLKGKAEVEIIEE